MKPRKELYKKLNSKREQLVLAKVALRKLMAEHIQNRKDYKRLQKDLTLRTQQYKQHLAYLEDVRKIVKDLVDRSEVLRPEDKKLFKIQFPKTVTHPVVLMAEITSKKDKSRERVNALLIEIKETKEEIGKLKKEILDTKPNHE